MQEMYLKKENIWSIKPSSGCSSSWSSIIKARDWIIPKARYLLFEGKTTNLWYDPWINGKGLRQLLGRLSYDWGPPKVATVSAFITQGHCTSILAKQVTWGSLKHGRKFEIEDHPFMNGQNGYGDLFKLQSIVYAFGKLSSTSSPPLQGYIKEG
ncbi:hypothetical protein QJS04_geneDACA020389 [Acorus gramineus]|uniref:Uncharacterized protein n=1 Tax=Acorus gramineus TaxID=55184 RepID=A0AAV9A332_ACOGR|nr:hypothetical protein QJS04_geneDACA020389 [Acorus gramineus]